MIHYLGGWGGNLTRDSKIIIWDVIQGCVKDYVRGGCFTFIIVWQHFAVVCAAFASDSHFPPGFPSQSQRWEKESQ